ncbi:4-hydroxy-3-methylbut-2-enyl diphosphate reductase [Ferruginivarius sediminum]|uniref:4-hydroxy-3-methylbut-2-enyl diphosphate reductase n=1 Tax=Ferruginivarius sediminum TaxID=2661937 RepID=A0A369TEF0_9PROT|nr:4-hydroxy-3-methylbut-2-enyl diphosphate reductase [Ferruginivarius sediminum]RDD63719.1 4-hydroxy-3-methylbut-2-enyl diphosphate reductase [Ferruginivarius sediminum]
MSNEIQAGSALKNGSLRVLLAKPRGFCAGVERAIDIVERALRVYGPPVYVRHEIVHNQRVVESLRAKGARFVQEVNEVPAGAVTVFSAHGVARKVETDAAAGGLKVIDATCPLVAKVHKEGQRYAGQGCEVVLIGHRGHPEVEGTLGRVSGPVHLVSTVAEAEALLPTDGGRLAYVTQTTLSVDDTRDIIAVLRRRFPAIQGPDVRDICYATQNRQTAVRALASESDVVLVVGAPNSSNSNRLREIAEVCGRPAYLVPDAGGLNPEWLGGAGTVGITAGASAPEQLVQELIAAIAARYHVSLETLPGVEEHVRFRMPADLAHPV